MATVAVADPTRSAFQAMALSGRGDAAALAAGMREEVTGIGLLALSAKLLHVAVCVPERLVEVYDGAALAWLSRGVYPPSKRSGRETGPPPAFWPAFWRLVETPAATRRPGPFTRDTIALINLLPDDFQQRVARTALQFPAVEAMVAAGPPAPIPFERLALMSPASFGGQVWAAKVQREQAGEDLRALGAAVRGLPAPLDALNAHVLEHHIAWGVLAGFGADELDSLAQVAFQAAQFGHHYSSVVLALAATTLALERPAGLELVLDFIFRGWLHGRDTPPLIGAPWNDLWDLPPEAARHALKITPFDGPLAAPGSQALRI